MSRRHALARSLSVLVLMTLGCGGTGRLATVDPEPLPSESATTPSTGAEAKLPSASQESAAGAASSAINAPTLTQCPSGPCKVVGVAASELSVCFLTEQGSVRCEGDNQVAQLGDGTNDDSPVPVDVIGLQAGVTQITGGSWAFCGLVNGGVSCWGQPLLGAVEVAVPATIVGLESGVTQVDYGAMHGCAVQSGEVRCWGYNETGQLGNGTKVSSEKAVKVSGLSGAAMVKVSTNGASLTFGFPTGGWTMALTSAGGVVGWGANSFGQLGTGDTNPRAAPAPVVGLSSGVTQIAVGYGHACALQGGNVLCWGANIYGQLGDATQTPRKTPAAVSGLGSGVKAIAAAGHLTCALTAHNGVKCWGLGPLGDGSRPTSSTPVDVVGLTSGVASIDLGGTGTACAVLQSSAVKCWGGFVYKLPLEMRL